MSKRTHGVAGSTTGRSIAQLRQRRLGAPVARAEGGSWPNRGRANSTGWPRRASNTGRGGQGPGGQGGGEGSEDWRGPAACRPGRRRRRRRRPAGWRSRRAGTRPCPRRDGAHGPGAAAPIAHGPPRGPARPAPLSDRPRSPRSPSAPGAAKAAARAPSSRTPPRQGAVSLAAAEARARSGRQHDGFQGRRRPPRPLSPSAFSPYVRPHMTPYDAPRRKRHAPDRAQGR